MIDYTEYISECRVNTIYMIEVAMIHPESRTIIQTWAENSYYPWNVHYVRSSSISKLYSANARPGIGDIGVIPSNKCLVLASLSGIPDDRVVYVAASQHEIFVELDLICPDMHQPVSWKLDNVPYGRTSSRIVNAVIVEILDTVSWR
jgi:hypothetical protein